MAVGSRWRLAVGRWQLAAVGGRPINTKSLFVARRLSASSNETNGAPVLQPMVVMRSGAEPVRFIPTEMHRQLMGSAQESFLMQ